MNDVGFVNEMANADWQDRDAGLLAEQRQNGSAGEAEAVDHTIGLVRS